MTKVKVEAPSNLGEGYQLTADVDGTSVVVVIPEGGVKQGEIFEGTSSLRVVLVALRSLKTEMKSLESQTIDNRLI